MLETLDQHMIHSYAALLRRELIVQGLKDKCVDEVMREATGHLEDAMAAAKPQSEVEVRQVISQFGSAALMAKKLAAEELRLSTRKRFLWPMAFVPTAIYLSVNPLPQDRVFHNTFYMGTVIMLISVAVLFLMGVRARRPLFGQFLALTGGLIVCQVGWYLATSYPVAYGPAGRAEWYVAIPRNGYVRQIRAMQAGIAMQHEIAQRVSLGQTVFSGAKPSTPVPHEFTYGGRYWLPEGIREVGLGIKVSEINQGLLTYSWKVAVASYNGREAGRVGVGSPWEGDGARQLRQIPGEIAYAQRAIDYLQWIRAQSLSVQLVADFRMVATNTVIFCALGAVFTNAGWVAWLIGRMLGRVRRRMLYRGNHLEGAHVAR